MADPKKRTKHYSLAEINKALPTSVSEKYKVTAAVGKRSTLKFYDKKFGIIDFQRIHIKQVDALMKKECPYFEKKSGTGNSKPE